MSDRPGVFLHVGYPKAGSSFLQEWFARHPELAYSAHGIGGMRSSADIHELADSVADGPVRWLVTSDEDLAFWKGPIDPVGARLQPYDVSGHRQRVCRLLATLHPNARVLVVTRGFATISKSAYSQYLRIGGILRYHDWCQAHGDLMSRFWDYGEIVALLTENFGSDRLLVLPWELLNDDAQSFLGLLSGFLDIQAQAGSTLRPKAAIPVPSQAGYRRLSNVVFRATEPLTARARTAFYQRYARTLAADGWARARRIVGGAGSIRVDPAPDAGWLKDTFGGRAALLADLPHYERYGAAYLLNY